MQIVKCDRCGGQTKEKTITGGPTSKNPGKQFTVYECQGNCMAGRFKYSCFPPHVPNTTTPPVAMGNGGAKSDAALSLRSIDTTLKNILSILQTKSGNIPIQPSELQPDEEIPF